MIESYVHFIHFVNGAELSFDNNEPIKTINGFCPLKSNQNGDLVIINTDQINLIEIKHLTLTEEEYKKKKKLLNHEE